MYNTKLVCLCDLYLFKYYNSAQIMFKGKIPLRHLVYRVVDIPQSMRHLVYDFGQLNVVTEDDYIAHIVNNHVSIVVS